MIPALVSLVLWRGALEQWSDVVALLLLAANRVIFASLGRYHGFDAVPGERVWGFLGS